MLATMNRFDGTRIDNVAVRRDQDPRPVSGVRELNSFNSVKTPQSISPMAAMTNIEAASEARCLVAGSLANPAVKDVRRVDSAAFLLASG